MYEYIKYTSADMSFKLYPEYSPLARSLSDFNAFYSNSHIIRMNVEFRESVGGIY